MLTSHASQTTNTSTPATSSPSVAPTSTATSIARMPRSVARGGGPHERPVALGAAWRCVISGHCVTARPFLRGKMRQSAGVEPVSVLLTGCPARCSRLQNNERARPVTALFIRVARPTATRPHTYRTGGSHKPYEAGRGCQSVKGCRVASWVATVAATSTRSRTCGHSAADPPAASHWRSSCDSRSALARS